MDPSVEAFVGDISGLVKLEVLEIYQEMLERRNGDKVVLPRSLEEIRIQCGGTFSKARGTKSTAVIFSVLAGIIQICENSYCGPRYLVTIRD